MKKLIIFLTFLILIIVLVLSGCARQNKIKNPALDYCIEHGGTGKIKINNNGSQYNVCILNDGTICEERAYFAGDCPKAQINISKDEVMRLVKNSYLCKNAGEIGSTALYNEITKTWWIDLESDLKNCNPACVVDMESKNITINWRCTGLLEDTTPPPLDTDYNEKILDKLDYVLNNIKDIRYLHNTIDLLYIDESIGKYHTDCSGFVDFVLKDILPNHYNIIYLNSAYIKWNRSRSIDYYNFFKDISEKDNCWQRVANIENIKPGDIVSYTYKPEEDKEDTGHVMFVYSEPKKIECYEDGCEYQYSFNIVDSTSKKHGTREGDNDTENGVGYGKIWLGFDKEKGKFIRWYESDGYMNDYLIEIARPVYCD